jgi:hypothetical protein
MSDPVTVGALAAATLAMAGEAIFKSGVGEVVKDAYKALKEAVATRMGSDSELSKNVRVLPSQQVAIAEAIDAQSLADQADIRSLATALNEALLHLGRTDPIGIDVHRLEADRVRLAAIDVTAGVGLRAGEVKATGDFEVGPISVGKGKR